MIDVNGVHSVNDTLESHVCEVVAATFGLDPQQVTAGDSAQTIPAWTSLAHLRLMASLEQTFGVRFTMQEMAAMSNIAMIESVLAARGVPA